MLRKITVVALLMSLVLSITPQAWAATPLERLAEVEVSLFGAPQAGALLQRLNHAEATLFGKPVGSQDPIVVRIEKLARLVTGSGASGASLIMKLNAAEWMIFQDQTMAIPLFDRLEKIEKDVYGDPSQGIGVEERINDLVSLVWPGGVLNTGEARLLPGTTVKIKLLTELSSTTSKEGDLVHYQVLSDVSQDNKLVIPTGACGTGVVQKVKKAGPFGQEGQVGIDFGSLRAIDGTLIPMTFQPRSASGVGQGELAAGASLGGMVLLGPLGLAAGYLVQGKAQSIPVGTELTVEVKDAVTVRALSLLPLQ
ncbi:MAG: hypothetical protein ACOX4G_15045 [Limnochordia bacterium]